MNRRLFEKWDEARAAASRSGASRRGEFLKKEILIAVRYPGFHHAIVPVIWCISNGVSFHKKSCPDEEEYL
jgi:hypothetical protein